MKRLLLAALATVSGFAAVLLVPATPASAHPLGNFSVNEYVGLTLRPDRIEALVVVDLAEIPTLQDRPLVDADHDASVSPAEAAAHAQRVCTDVGAQLWTRVDGEDLMWTVSAAHFGHVAGVGGLDVSQARCELGTAVNVGTTVEVENRYLADRVGWRELTARGVGIGLVDPPVPAESISDELRAYPSDLLSSVVDVRAATLRVRAGDSDPGAALVPTGGDGITQWMASADRRLQALAGGELTPLIGLLAVLLSLLLGAGHALLPGHGKTVLAAYLAGRQGRRRDAVSVAGTVTLAHTGSVLAIGLLLAAGTAITGERLLSWLGLASAALILAVGLGMCVALVRARRRQGHDHHAHDHYANDHRTHDHRTHDHHTHDHHEDWHAHAHAHAHGHDHGHGHDHQHADEHGHGHEHSHDRGARRRGRLSLAGIGLAGGLVPSPSALVVLLAAIGLGRTAFGVLLVIAYGLGMAATLTGAGLLLLAVQRRMSGRDRVNRLARIAAWLHTATPAATAALVVLVGAGLAARAASAVI